MSKLKLTLQNRITTLMIISSIIFISAFVFIQINNQITNINRYNSYQANLSAGILKNNIEATLRQIQPQEIPTYIHSTLKELKDSQLIKEVTVFDQNGKIFGSTDDALLDQNASYKDIYYFQILKESSKTGKWMLPEIDNAKQSLNLYIAIKLDPKDELSYVAKSSFPFAGAQEAMLMVYKPAIIAIIIIIIANIIFGYLLSKNIIGPIKMLNSVTKIIANGDLTIRTQIKTNDELEELGSTFNYMTEQLIKMKERAENANPLTKLPGNIMIHEDVEKRITSNKKFVVIYCDLDNFKAFNDKYGIGQGDVAIKITANIFKQAAQTKGNPDDFVGHEGGDDFIITTTPQKAQEIANYIMEEFDKQICSLYTPEDLAQGYIIAHARDNSIKKFPIMTISLAGVTNETRKISSYAEVTNIAAEVKKKAKAIEKSVFVLDKRD